MIGLVKYTVTSELDTELYEELERERKAAGLSRSAGMRQAVEWWIAQRKEHGEERVGRQEKRHRQVMRRFDYLIGMIREQERLLGLPAGDPANADSANRATNRAANGAGDYSVELTEPESVEAATETRADERAGESPLSEARKRARRRVE